MQQQHGSYNPETRRYGFSYGQHSEQLNAAGPAVGDQFFYRRRGGEPLPPTALGSATGHDQLSGLEMYHYRNQQPQPQAQPQPQVPYMNQRPSFYPPAVGQSTVYDPASVTSGPKAQDPSIESGSILRASHQPLTQRPLSQPYPASQSASNKRHKHARDEEEEEEEEEMEDEGTDVPADGKSVRAPGACAPCKHLKIKCVFESRRADACKNCIRRGKECTVPERRPRRAPPKRDELIKSIRDKDALIGQLIEQLEARSSSLTPVNLALTGDSAHAAHESSIPTDPLAKEAIQKEVHQREKEIQEWLKKAKATIEKSNAMDFGLLGGTANPVLSDGEEDDDSSDYAIDSEGSDDYYQETSPLSAHTGTGNGSERRRPLKREDSLISSQSKKSGSGNSGNTKGSALPTNAPMGLIAKMGKNLRRRRSSRTKSRGSSPRTEDAPVSVGGPKGTDGDDDDGEQLGVSNPEFFLPSDKPYAVPNGEKLDLPPILAKNIIGPKEVKELFDVYFDYMNLSTCILDPKLYTPEKTLYRSSFLFTVVCAIASRFHPSRTSLYPILMNYARLAAGTAIISGRKSLEACQAYILLSLYPMPVRSWSEDRSWMYLGCAIRMATDLNLHHPPVLEGGEPAVTISTIMDVEWQSREILNRTRCWLGCFNADKAMSTQFGKPTTLREDWMFPLLQRNMSEGDAEWWCPTPFGWKFDIHLCAYSALLREISNFHEQVYSDPTNPTGLNENIAFEELTYEFDNRIETMAKEWFHRVDTHMANDDPECIFRKGLLQLEFYYNQLVALSFGFQHAFRRGAIKKDNGFLQRCYSAAIRVVRIVVDELGNQKYMRYCPESHYIFATFASAFLLKLLRPKFSPFLEVHQHHEVLDLVKRLAGTLNRVAMDDRHAPKLYSRFLIGLVKKGEKILAKGSNASSVSSPTSSIPQNNGSSPANHSHEIPPAGASGSGGVYLPEILPSPTTGAYPPGQQIPQPQYVQNQDPQTRQYMIEDTVFDNMDGVANTLPQTSWVHGNSVNPGDGDTLMSMQLFGDQFWEEALLPGFTWTGSTNVHHGDNIVTDYSNVAGNVSFDNPGGFNPAAVPTVPQVIPAQQGFYQRNPVQAFPSTSTAQQQQQHLNQFQFHP